MRDSLSITNDFVSYRDFPPPKVLERQSRNQKSKCLPRSMSGATPKGRKGAKVVRNKRIFLCELSVSSTLLRTCFAGEILSAAVSDCEDVRNPRKFSSIVVRRVLIFGHGMPCPYFVLLRDLCGEYPVPFGSCFGPLCHSALASVLSNQPMTGRSPSRKSIAPTSSNASHRICSKTRFTISPL